MSIDLDAFEERAAILEFDAGFSRFDAETIAAAAQGATRWQIKEARNAHSLGNPATTRDHREAHARHGAHHLPPMQRGAEEQARPVPQRDVQA